MMTGEPEVVCDEANLCGEGPLWDPVKARLLWVDSERGRVYAHHPGERRSELISSTIPVSGIALNRDDGLVLAGNAGIHLWRSRDDSLPLVTRWGNERLVFNDCLADPHGRLYSATYYWLKDKMQKTGCLYLLHQDGTLELMDEGFQISNGLGLSPDARTLYFADSGARAVYAYDVEPGSGRLKNRRELLSLAAEDGLPDGLTVDSEGYVWTALWYAGEVVRADPDGREERRIHLPAKQVSSVAFGGPDLNDLYVTSASEYWPSPHAPRGMDTTALMGGALYRLRTDVKGKLEYRTDFGGEPGQKT